MFPKVSGIEWVIPVGAVGGGLRGVALLEEVLSLGSGFEKLKPF